MGVPPEIEYGNDCLACWAAGKTPRYLYMSLTEIVTGPLWLPWMDPPPNGVWQLEQVHLQACNWGLFSGLKTFTYRAGAAGIIFVGHAAASSPFDSGPLAPCSGFAISLIVPPPLAAFYYGKAQMSEIP